MTSDTTLKQRYLVANFIGLAMVASVFLYAVVVEVMQRLLAPFAGLGVLTPDQARFLKYVLAVLALGHFFLIKLCQKLLSGPSLKHLFQTAILTFALCEAVAIYGLVLFLLTGQVFDFYLFFALSLSYFYLFYPRYATWELVWQGDSEKPTPE